MNGETLPRVSSPTETLPCAILNPIIRAVLEFLLPLLPTVASISILRRLVSFSLPFLLPETNFLPSLFN